MSEPMSYPPEPWDLRGSGEITVWALRTHDLPALPAGVRAARVAGRTWACTAFVDYGEGSLLAYHELLAAVVVHDGRGLGLSITDIWVDSPASRAGGRELWGIPKDLADFSRHQGRWRATLDGAPLADAVVRPAPLPAVPLPGLRAGILQTLDHRTVRTPIRAAGRVRLARSRWALRPEGPLGWLATARPLVSVTAEEFRMRFGA